MNKTVKRERRWIAILTVSALALTIAPYLYGYLVCPPAKEFLGLIGQNGHDQAFYLAWGPRQAERGYWLFEDKYNGFTMRRAVFNPLWLATGWLARFPGLTVLAAFHIERVVSSLALLLTIYTVIARFIDPGAGRIIAFFLIVFSSGLGVFTIPVEQWGDPAGIFTVPSEQWTPDLWVIEANVFLTILWETVLPAGTALFLLALYLGYHTLWHRPGIAPVAGLATLFLGMVYPYAVISVYAIIAVAALYRARQHREWSGPAVSFGTIFVISLPIVLYNYVLVVSNPKLTTGQALFPSPHLGSYFLGFGLLGACALGGAVLVLHQRLRRWYFPLIWAGVTLLQIYLPIGMVPFQMQLILGIQVPLAILAVAWLSAVGQRCARRRALWRVALAAALIFSTATSVYHYTNVFAQLRTFDLPDYIDRDTAAAMRWLDANTSEEDLVLAAPRIAPYIPVLSHNRMFTGDYAAPTADFAAKFAELQWLCNPRVKKTPAEIIHWFRNKQIDYVFYDSNLRELSDDTFLVNLLTLPQFTVAHQTANVIILRFSPRP